MSNPSNCPLCGEPNQCQLIAVGTYKGPCWCESMKFTPDLLARVPADQVNKSCICKRCAETAPRESHRQMRSYRDLYITGDASGQTTL